MIINDLNKVPHFGFGLMRLPVKDGRIDIPQVSAMVDAFMEKGFRYFDTAYPYHSGESERVVKEVLVNRYPREDFLLATKLPGWELHSREDMQKIFDTQLERTGAGYFDFYLLHSVEKAWYEPYYERFDCFRWAMELKEKGLIRHFGISFHDDAELLDRVLTEHPEIEFVQQQLNYLDWEDTVVQSRRIHEVCRKHGKFVNVMEPVKGGTLAQLPPDAEKILKDADPDSSIASWALRFALSQEGIMVVLSGMSTKDQMQDNLKTASEFRPLEDNERKLLEKVVSVMSEKPSIGCTGCRYCVAGCPKGILIPDLFRSMNSHLMYGENHRAKRYYYNSTKNGNDASACIKCGRCERSCPQHLPIRDLLTQVSEVFDHGILDYLK